MNINNNPAPIHIETRQPLSEVSVKPSLDKQLEGLSSPKSENKVLKESSYVPNSAVDSFLEKSLKSLSQSIGSEKLLLMADSYGADKKNMSNVSNGIHAAHLSQLAQNP